MSRLTNLPIRSRIAIIILAMSGGLLIAMSTGVYFAFERSLNENLDETLDLRAETNVSLVDLSSGQPALLGSSDPRRERALGEALLRLFLPDGQRVADASSQVGTSSEEEHFVLSAGRSGENATQTLSYGDHEKFRVRATPILEDGAVRAVLLTGLERSVVTEPLSVLRAILLIAVPLTSLALGAGAFFIARRALQPVASITATARQIAEGDLHRRIEGPAARDEVGELATAFNDMIARLAATLERERRFTSDASHELRTPLTAIETTIDVALSHDAPEESRQILMSLRAQTVKMIILTRDLLLLARLDASALGRTFESLDLSGVVEAVVESFREDHPEAEITLSLPSGPLPIHGDLELLARAFTNVFNNGLIHGGSGTQIRVSAHRMGGRTTVRISDDGPGIAPELLPVVFQRFRRGDAAGSKPGSGLGLAIVQSIIEAHQGTVRATSGNGATIEVLLPLAGIKELEAAE